MDSPKEKEILFYNEEVDYELQNKEDLKNWIRSVASKEGKSIGALNIVLCTDEYLHALNVEFLDHDTLTDIITFPSETEDLSGDIFISLDRIKENANIYRVDLSNELHRVIIHGVLHMCGYEDKSQEQRLEMRQKEEESLRLLRDSLE